MVIGFEGRKYPTILISYSKFFDYFLAARSSCFECCCLHILYALDAQHEHQRAAYAQTGEHEQQPAGRDRPEGEQVADLVAVRVRNELVVGDAAVHAVHPHVADYEPDEEEEAEQAREAAQYLGLTVLVRLAES